MGGELFFFIQSLKKKGIFLERFFQVIHLIIVADEGVGNRAVANALHLSCLARDLLLSFFFFPFSCPSRAFLVLMSAAVFMDCSA